MEAVGRLSSVEAQMIMNDEPSMKVKAILSKQDEIIAKLNLILAAVEAATDAASLFTALDVAEIKTQLNAVVLNR